MKRFTLIFAICYMLFFFTPCIYRWNDSAFHVKEFYITNLLMSIPFALIFALFISVVVSSFTRRTK